MVKCVHTGLIFSILMIILIAPAAHALSSGFITQDPENTSQYTVPEPLVFTGSSTDPGNLYMDAFGANPDVGVQLCGNGQRYVGGFYALKVNATWHSALVTYSSSDEALAYTSENLGDGCYGTQPGFLTVSPSQLTTPEPDVRKAALPGNLWIGYATEANPDTITDYVYAANDARLDGGYTVPASFNRSTSLITVQTPDIKYITSSSSFSKPATDSAFGISSTRPLVMGVCDDMKGENCSDGAVFTSASFPHPFNTGLEMNQTTDQATHTKNIITNGLSQKTCVGANLKASIKSMTPEPLYYNDSLRIEFDIKNPRDTPYENDGGNVKVTSPFNTTIKVHAAGDESDIIFTDTLRISEEIPVDGKLSRTIDWPAKEPSGNYTVSVETDVGDEIAECNETDNSVSQQFELLPVVIPQIYVDGTRTNTFPLANTPYNLTIHLSDSDGHALDNASLTLSEKNGLNIAVPTQTYTAPSGPSQSSKTGVVPVSQAKFTTDHYGNASFTYIPTYNDLYSSSGFNLSEYVGAHSITIYGSDKNGDELMFLINGTLASDYPLYINNTTHTGAHTQKTLPHETIVSQVMDYAYHTYTNFLRSILG
ncbi:MAG: CARDB domain-containing protein [Candidatus Woesearchaeota archaeon]